MIVNSPQHAREKMRTFLFKKSINLNRKIHENLFLLEFDDKMTSYNQLKLKLFLERGRSAPQMHCSLCYILFENYEQISIVNSVEGLDCLDLVR